MGFEETVLGSLKALMNSVTPPDLSGLHAVVARGQAVADKFQTLVPMEAKTMSNPQNPSQSEIDTDVAALNQTFTTFDSVFTDLQTQLAAIPDSVDVSALTALVQKGQDELAKYQGIDTVNPVQPAQPVDPTPAPVDPVDPTPAPDPNADPTS